jgi:hypothetical protein
VLRVLAELESGFYLTGGTATSRGYLHHRFSDDLDLFVNDDNRFGLWAERVIQALASGTSSLEGRSDWRTSVLLRQERFVRLTVFERETSLKIELVNDVPAHVGPITYHAVLGRLDSAENILANKVTALIDREEPKDLADIWGFCYRMKLSIVDAIEGAQSKAAGVFPADLARLLCSASRADWEVVRWIDAPEVEQFVADLQRLGENLILLRSPDETQRSYARL